MTDRSPYHDDELADHVWRIRYRHGGEQDRAASLGRVAHAIAAAETDNAAHWEQAFDALMRDGLFLPGGRIIAGAGTDRRLTLCNCFVMGEIEDSAEGIDRALQEGAITMRQGGGIGYDFSTLRPSGTPADGAGAVAPGPVSCMHAFDDMCAMMPLAGGRRGAMMATLRIDHPDIEQFIDAKREAGVLGCFNLSALVSDAFLSAVREDRDWPLLFPDVAPGAEILERWWPGHDGLVPCSVHRWIIARALWERLMHAAYDFAEPGVLFIDRINEQNNLGYCEQIGATNPCGEVPMPAYGACVLGSFNLPALVQEPFTPGARLDMKTLERAVGVAVRMLDDVMDVSHFPLPAQREQALASRRIGIGVMGLADALVMLGQRYDSEVARTLAREVMRAICHEAYRSSIDLAREKGCFPLFDRERYLAAPFVAALPADIRDGIARHGIRNSHLTAIAPTGTISLLAGGVSSGLEPLLGPEVERKVLQADQDWQSFTTTAVSVRLWRQHHPGLPPAFVCAEGVAPADQLAMQAALQIHVDNSISKTVAIPADFPFEDFSGIFEQAHALGLKGCTVFRPGGVRGCTAKPA